MTNITLGTHDTERRKAALLSLAADVGAIGRNGGASISWLMCRLADAYESEPEATTDHVTEVMRLVAPRSPTIGNRR